MMYTLSEKELRPRAKRSKPDDVVLRFVYKSGEWYDVAVMFGTDYDLDKINKCWRNYYADFDHVEFAPY